MMPIFFLHALYAFATPLNKILLAVTQPFFLAGTRLLCAGFFSWLLFAGTWQIRKGHGWYFISVGLFWYFKYIFKYWSLAQMSAIKMAFLLNCGPCIIAILSCLLLKEPIFRRQWLGVGIGTLSTIPLLLSNYTIDQCISECASISLYDGVLLAAVIMHAYGMIQVYRLVRLFGYCPIAVNGIGSLIAGFLALSTAYAYEPCDVASPASMFIGLCSVLIIVTDLMCKSVYYSLLKKHSLVFVAMTDFLNPFFVAVYSYFLWNVPIPLYVYTSGTIAAIGLIVCVPRKILSRPATQSMSSQGVLGQILED